MILGFFAHLFANLKSAYSQSYTKVLFERFMRSLESGKKNSAIISILSAESKLGQRWKNSMLYRLLVYPFAIVGDFACKRHENVEKMLAESNILRNLKAILYNIFNYSIRSYGILLFSLFSIEAILWVALQTNEMKYLALRAVLILFSLLLMLINMPVASLFKGSALYRLIEGAFADGFSEYDAKNRYQSKKLLHFALTGAVFGLLAYLMPLKAIVMGAAVFITVLLVLWRFEIGVYLAAGFAALLPTTPLLLLIALTLASFTFRWLLGKTAKYKATPLDALVIMFFTVLIYSTFTSYFIKDSISVLAVHSLFIAFYFVVVRTVNTRHKLYLLMLFLIISGALTSLYGIYQYYNGGASTDAWIDRTMFEDIRSRVGATFNNPNILGEYLIMMIPLGFAALWYKKKPFYNIVFLAMVALMGVCMILTFSRGAWLGLILAVGAFFVIRDKRMLALVLVLLLMSPFIMPQSIINRFTSIGNMQDTSSSYRMSILMGSLRMAQDYWISGIGLGSQAFKAIYPKYSLAAAYALHSHNIYIQVLLETGAAGALIFSLLIIVFLRAMLAHQGKTKDRFLSTIMIAAGAGVAGYLLQGVVENIWYNYRVMLTFWVMLAVGISALRIGKAEVDGND